MIFLECIGSRASLSAKYHRRIELNPVSCTLTGFFLFSRIAEKRILKHFPVYYSVTKRGLKIGHRINI